jgi:hypothetical protein
MPLGMSLASLIAPFATLAILALAGLGTAGLIAPRAPREAQAALAPLVTSAILFVTSPIGLIGMAPLLLGLGVLGLLTLTTVVRRRQSIAIVRRAALPAVVAFSVVAIYAAPAFRHGTWAAATTGNQDAYLWVSQARSVEDGAPSGAEATTPDRIAYHHLLHDAWPTAIPVSLAELAAVERVDPVHAYGVFSVVIAAMLALGVLFGAHGCLHWPKRRSTVAAASVALNGLVLLSSFYGWQAQLLLTTTGTLFVLMAPGCLRPGTRALEFLGPSLFAAAAAAIYGWTIAPFVFVALAVCWSSRERMVQRRLSLRSFALKLGALVTLTAAMGADAIIRAAISLAHGSQNASAAARSFWDQYAWAYPSDALGLVPRTPRNAPGIGWELVAGLVAGLLIVRALWSARSARDLSRSVLAVAAIAIIVELIALALGGSGPYPSLKLMGYAAPILTLFTLSSRWWSSGGAKIKVRTPRSRTMGIALLNVTAGTLFFATTAYALSTGLLKTRPATEVVPAARAAGALPSNKVTLLAVNDPWDQVWLAYFLRDRPLAVRQPSIAFAGYSARDASHAPRFDAPAVFEIRERSPGPYLWRDHKFRLYALKRPSA